MSDELIFVGTGVSTGIPVIGHLDGECACALAMSSPNDPNRRNNVSLLIRRRITPQTPAKPPPRPIPQTGSQAKTEETFDRQLTNEEKTEIAEKKRPAQTFFNVLIDAGKTFRDAYFRTMAPEGVDTLTSILITHDHADAMAGLDDARDLQHFDFVGKQFVCRYYIPTYMSSKTLALLTQQAGYIVSNSIVRGTQKLELPTAEEEADLQKLRDRPLERRVTCLEIHEVSETIVEPMKVKGLEGVPCFTVPVFHGGSYRCLGFAFGNGLRLKGVPEAEQPGTGKGAAIVYISDVSAIPDDTMGWLKSLERIDILVLDVLLGPGDSHYSHWCLDQAWDCAVELQPKRAIGIGMFCSVKHDDGNAELAKRVAALKAEKGTACNLESFVLGNDGLKILCDL